MDNHPVARLSVRLSVVVVFSLTTLLCAGGVAAGPRSEQAAPNQGQTLAGSEDEAAIRTLVTAYYEAYGRGDFVAMAALWHPSAGGLATWKAVTSRDLARRRFVFADLEISNVQAAVSGGSARVTVTATITLVADGSSRTERWHRRQGFLRQGTEWKLWIDQSASELLASEVARAATPEARDALLAAQPELVNSELIEGISLAGSRAQSVMRLDRAAELLDLAAKLARQSDNREMLARTLTRLGSLATLQQQWDSAYLRNDEALALYEALGDGREASLCRLSMANARYSGRRYADALPLYESAVTGLTARTDAAAVPGAPAAPPSPADRTMLPGAVQGLANTHFMLGDLTRARDAYDRARELHERAGNPYGVASALEAVGRVHRDQGEYAAALDALEKAVAVATAAKLSAVVVTSVRGIVETYRLQGQYDRAVGRAQEGIALAQSIGDRAGVAELTFEIGLAFASERRWLDALAAYERALSLEKEASNQDRIARALAASGTVLSAQGRHDAALDRFRASLAIRESLGDQPRIAWTLVHIGMALEAKELHEEALASLHRAMMLFDQIGDTRPMGIVHAITGDVHVARGDAEQALVHTARAAGLAESTGDLDTLAHAKLTAGRAHRLAGAVAPALASLEGATAALDRLDADVVDVLPDRFFGETVAPFHELADLLVAENRPSEALAVSERARVRLLRAIIGRVGARLARGLPPAVREDEARLAREVVSLNNQVDKERERQRPDPDRLAKLEVTQAVAKRSLEVMRAGLYEQHPHLAVMRGRASPPDLAAIRSATVDCGWPAVSFIVAERRVVGFVLRPGESAPRTFAIDIGPADLAARVGAYRELVERRKTGIRDEARELYDLIWKPAATILGDAAKVVVVPDGVLWALPFETLIDPKARYVIESTTIAYAPSLAALVWRSRAGSPAAAAPGSAPTTGIPMLAFGNPIIADSVRARYGETRRELKLNAMPEADREVRLVASVADPTRSVAVTGARARKSILDQNVGSTPLLHLAVPAILSDASPMFSELLLAPDPAADVRPTLADEGTVTAAEVTTWENAPSRTVLSRAENESPTATTGESLLGLSWALDVVGCPTLVISRWRAESLATPGLMAAMYRRLRTPAAAKRTPLTTAEALRQAQLTVLRSPARREPWFWAGFLTLGAVGR